MVATSLEIMNTERAMQDMVSFFIFWTIAPIILFSLLFFALRMGSKAPNPEAATSAKAGFFAGLILFIVFVIFNIETIEKPNFFEVDAASLNYLYAGYGIVIGFGMLFGVRLFQGTRRVGFMVLILVTSCLCLLYSLVFLTAWRTIILSLVLGLGFGILFHICILPGSVKSLLEESGVSKQVAKKIKMR
jgi:peptidoglycan/LPS O-acetylase OafA/YrhL